MLSASNIKHQQDVWLHVGRCGLLNQFISSQKPGVEQLLDTSRGSIVDQVANERAPESDVLMA